jgi:cold shock protein
MSTTGMLRRTGTVKCFSEADGFGFIRPDGSNQDVFVHASAIQGDGDKSLAQGDRVVFDAGWDPRGPRAVNVVKLS